MKLKDAMLCVECEEIFEPAGVYRIVETDIAQCPACGNAVTMRLSCWLGTMNAHEKTGQAVDTSAAPVAPVFSPSEERKDET